MNDPAWLKNVTITPIGQKFSLGVIEPITDVERAQMLEDIRQNTKSNSIAAYLMFKEQMGEESEWLGS